jgi:presenilin-like A22 family membrane protease
VLRILEAHEMVGILALFLIVQFGGFTIALLTHASGTTGLIISRLVSQQSVFFSYGIDALLIAIIFLLLINRYRKHNNEFWDHKFFVVFEAAVLTATSFFAFVFLFTSVLPSDLQGWYFLVSLVAALAVVGLRERNRHAKNAATIISSIGVGLVLGFYFSFLYTVLLLAIVALYDYSAVFITKSMIKLANKFTDEDVAFLVSEEDVEAIPQDRLSKDQIKDYLNEMNSRFDFTDPLFKEAVEKNAMPVVSRIQLGEGDLGLPLMTVVSLYFTFSSTFAPILVIVGAAIGLIVTMRLLKRYKRALPAIPPLFSFISMFSGLSLLMIGKITVLESALFVSIGVVVFFLGLMARLILDRARAAREGQLEAKKPAEGGKPRQLPAKRAAR